MAAPRRTPRLLALVWLAVAIWLAAASGGHCRNMPAGYPSGGPVTTPDGTPATPPRESCFFNSYIDRGAQSSQCFPD
ncbi:hypothetical protein EJB05_55400, partial [Eragrostis curvula]